MVRIKSARRARKEALAVSKERRIKIVISQIMQLIDDKVALGQFETDVLILTEFTVERDVHERIITAYIDRGYVIDKIKIENSELSFTIHWS